LASDRVEPTCGWCARNERVCEYKERKKPGLRAGYGRELEGRIDRLEALIHAQGLRLEDHILKHDASNHVQPTPLSANTSAETPQLGDGSYRVTSGGLRHASDASSGWPPVHGSEHSQYRHQPEGTYGPQCCGRIRLKVGACPLLLLSLIYSSSIGTLVASAPRTCPHPHFVRLMDAGGSSS
jgi:hypothetical protein